MTYNVNVQGKIARLPVWSKASAQVIRHTTYVFLLIAESRLPKANRLLASEGEDEEECGEGYGGGSEVGVDEAEAAGEGGHQEGAYGLAGAQRHAVRLHEGAAVLVRGVGV